MTHSSLYSSDNALEVQIRAAREARERAEARKVNNEDIMSGVIIDAEYIDVSATGDVRLITRSNDGKSHVE